MKIGFLISSLTQSIPYMSYVISLGYEVFPIMFRADSNKNNHLINIIEGITDKVILFEDSLQETEKLDCLIVMANPETMNILKNIDYNKFLKNNAPIICDIYQHQAFSDLSHSMEQQTIYIVDYKSKNIIDNCNCVISDMKKILQKK